MKTLLAWLHANKFQLIRLIFLLPILGAVVVSIVHVITWYTMGNPDLWAIYLSVAVEIGALASVAAASVGIRGWGLWLMFGLVTLIQFIGNVFFNYQFTNEGGFLFTTWVELTRPLFEGLGADVSNAIAQKRWLALLQGGTVPLLSLFGMHLFIKYRTPVDSGDESVKVDAVSEPKISHKNGDAATQKKSLQKPELDEYYAPEKVHPMLEKEVTDEIIKEAEKIAEEAQKKPREPIKVEDVRPKQKKSPAKVITVDDIRNARQRNKQSPQEQSKNQQRGFSRTIPVRK